MSHILCLGSTFGSNEMPGPDLDTQNGNMHFPTVSLPRCLTQVRCAHDVHCTRLWGAWALYSWQGSLEDHSRMRPEQFHPPAEKLQCPLRNRAHNFPSPNTGKYEDLHFTRWGSSTKPEACRTVREKRLCDTLGKDGPKGFECGCGTAHTTHCGL